MDPIGSDEEYDEEYDKEYDGDYDEEYELEHGDDSCDDEEVPVRVRKEIRKCIMDELFPDILRYMKVKGRNKFVGVEIEHVSLQLLAETYGVVKPFNKKRSYDLYAIHNIFDMIGKQRCPKKFGQELVGAAIRLSEAIDKKEHAGKLREIVKNCFTPNEERDKDFDIPGYLL